MLFIPLSIIHLLLPKIASLYAETCNGSFLLKSAKPYLHRKVVFFSSLFSLVYFLPTLKGVFILSHRLIFSRNTKSPLRAFCVVVVLYRLCVIDIVFQYIIFIPAVFYSPTPQGSSTIDAGGLNCRVRYGNGCDPSAIAAGNIILFYSYLVFLPVQEDKSPAAHWSHLQDLAQIILHIRV